MRLPRVDFHKTARLGISARHLKMSFPDVASPVPPSFRLRCVRSSYAPYPFSLSHAATSLRSRPSQAIFERTLSMLCARLWS